MEKLKQHYALADIKAAFADLSGLNRSFVSKQGADDPSGWMIAKLWPSFRR